MRTQSEAQEHFEPSGSKKCLASLLEHGRATWQHERPCGNLQNNSKIRHTFTMRTSAPIRDLSIKRDCAISSTGETDGIGPWIYWRAGQRSAPGVALGTGPHSSIGRTWYRPNPLNGNAPCGLRRRGGSTALAGYQLRQWHGSSQMEGSVESSRAPRTPHHNQQIHHNQQELPRRRWYA